MSLDTWMAALFDKPIGPGAVRLLNAFNAEHLAPAPAFSTLKVFEETASRRGLVHVHLEDIDSDLNLEFERLTEALGRQLDCEVQFKVLFDAEDEDDEFDGVLLPQRGSSWRSVSLATGRKRAKAKKKRKRPASAVLLRRFDRPLDPSTFAEETKGIVEAAYWPMYPPGDRETREHWAHTIARALRSAPSSLAVVDVGGLRIARGEHGALSSVTLPMGSLPHDAVPLLRALKGVVTAVSAPTSAAPLITEARDLLEVSVRIGS